MNKTKKKYTDDAREAVEHMSLQSLTGSAINKSKSEEVVACLTITENKIGSTSITKNNISKSA